MPKSSSSIKFSGIAAQFTAMNGLLAEGFDDELLWLSILCPSPLALESEWRNLFPQLQQSLGADEPCTQKLLSDPVPFHALTCHFPSNPTAISSHGSSREGGPGRQDLNFSGRATLWPPF